MFILLDSSNGSSAEIFVSVKLSNIITFYILNFDMTRLKYALKLSK